MPAALPTGGDPNFFDLGDFGMVGAAAAQLVERTQENIEELLKADMQGSAGWGLASSRMFAGLFPDGETPFPVLFLLAIAEQLLRFVPGGNTVIEILVEIGEFFEGKWLDLGDLTEDFIDLITGLVGSFDIDEVVEFFLNIPNQLQDVVGRWQALIDAIVQIFTRSTAIGNTLEDLLFALTNIHPDNVSGVWGPGTIREALEKLADVIGSGIVGEDGVGVGLADLRDLFEVLSSRAWQGWASFGILGIRHNRKLDSGLLPSERSNFNQSEVNTSFTISPGTARIAFDVIEESMPLGAVSWMGWGTAGITEFYVNVYRLGNLNGTGVAELIHESPNIVGVLDSGATSPVGGYNRYELDDPPTVEAEDLLGYEFITVGGNHTIRGKLYSLPEDPIAPVSAVAATRTISGDPGTPPATFDKDDITWSQEAPWVGIAVDTGSGDAHRDPEIRQLNGPTTLPIPPWCDTMDWIVLGKGGNGADGIIGLYGNPGSPGSYNTATLIRDTHFSDPGTIITFSGSSLSIPGFTLTANNGANGSGVRPVGLGKPVGRGPGNLEYNGITAVGGVDQEAYGGDGSPPGGAGNGGHWFGIYTQGGTGGPARAWVQFRKTSTTGGGNEGDTTPPNIAGLTVGVTATASTLTLSPSGAVDDA